MNNWLDDIKRNIETGTEEDKTKFNELLSGMGYKTDDQIKTLVEMEKSALVRKNGELKTEKDKIKEQLSALEQSSEAMTKMKELFEDFGMLDSSGKIDYDGLEEKLSALRTGKAPENDKEFRKLQREHRQREASINTLKQAVKDIESQRDGYLEYIDKELIPNQFVSALISENFDPVLSKFLVPTLRVKSNIKLEQREKDDGGIEWVAVTETGKSIPDWVRDFKDTPEGQSLRKAPINKGGGSGGSSGIAHKSFQELTWEEKAKLYKENPEQYNKLKSSN